MHNIATGGTQVSLESLDTILKRPQSIDKRDALYKEVNFFQADLLLISKRPPKVQEKIDEVYTLLLKNGNDWLHKGTIGLYNLLNFDDCAVIAQRIEKASPNKKDLYFVDLGAGHFYWVDSV